MSAKLRNVLAVLALAGAQPAAAHSFGRLPALPVPFWLYAWAAAATLVASFVAAGIFLGRGRAASAPAGPWHDVSRRLLLALRAFALAALALCIATGLAGTPGVYANFNMTCFWVVFGLGFTWLTALAGDWYAVLNPWRSLALLLERAPLAAVRGAWPARLGYWPAVVLYGAFVALELFARMTPHALSIALIAYTGLTLAGCARYGARDWLRHCEIFAVLLGLLARLAPLEVEERGAGGARWRRRPALSGLRAQAGGEGPGLVAFGLFVLSATAFDGLHEARPWVNLFWHGVYPRLLEPMGYSIYTGAAALLRAWRDWQLAWLFASPLAYLAAYAVALALMRALTGARGTLRELAQAFFPSLLPIALAYHVAHYATLLLAQGPRIVPLLSDPFGWGWNLFGTAQWVRATWVPDAMAVWHAQVGLILAGHVAGVAVAHREALRRFGGRRAALLSQLPLLALMVAFTVGGLWILSLPFEPGPIRYGG